MWANRDWIGRFLPATTRPAGLLGAYGQHFGTVEGNTTFYGLPGPATVRRWAAETGPDFRFLFKLPRSVTHERRLVDCGRELSEFCERVAPLGPRLGPASVQLPASFGPAQLTVLEAFLRALPDDRPWSVEVRHRDFFAGGSSEAALDALLAGLGIDRVILDSRALFSQTPVDEVDRAAHAAKPRLPVRPTATGTNPVVRVIGHRDADVSAAHWARWFPVVVRWVEQGRSPNLLFHTADNLDAPQQARRFLDELRAYAPGIEVVPEPGHDARPDAPAVLPLG